MRSQSGKARTVVLIVLILVGIPVGMLFYHAQRTGMSVSQILRRMFSRAAPVSTGLEDVVDESLPKGPPADFFERVDIGDPPGSKPGTLPRISHLAAVDLDRDGLLDVVLCDAQRHGVHWIRQHPRGTYTERVLAEGLIAPAHVQPVDFDGDGDLDLVVAVLGMLFPNNDRIGSVVVLENDGKMEFTRRVAAERIARVADVRAADLDGDGDLDLAAAQFGYDDGEARWIENLGGWKFESHILQTLSGPIFCPLEDMDQDGDIDIVMLVTQEWEEIYVFENDGKGAFTPKLVYGSTNEDFASSGICTTDLDRDGDIDILYTNGDAFDYIPPRPRPWHGVQWLENQGGMRFAFHRIADFHGAYSARPADVDGDGDLDVFVVSGFNLWEQPDAKSLILLENDGSMRFRRRDIAGAPTHMITSAEGDFDGDGAPDLVTGGMHTYPPYDRLGRVVLWLNRFSGKIEQ